MTQDASASTEVAPRDTRVQVNLNDPLSDLDGAFRLATMMAQSSMVPRALQGSPQNCLVTMMLGRELGLSWIQAIRGIYVLPNGTPGLRGSLLLARIRSAGHRYEFIEDDDSCEFVLTRKDEDYKVRYTGKFTVEDAKAAGLVKEHDGKLTARSRNGDPLPWELYRKDMLQWRAVARGVARGCPELIFGFDLAGTGEAEDGGTVVTAEVIPQPAPPAANGDRVRQQLAEMDRDLAATEHHMQRRGEGDDSRHDEPHTHPSPEDDVVVSEELPFTAGEETAQARAPGLAELHELLRRCGVSGPEQVRVSALLAHRDIPDMGQLTPGEIYMVHDTITRVTWGKSSTAARREALARYLATAEGVDDDDDETGSDQ